MVGQDIQYAATYKGVKDIVTIVKFAGQNDNRIFTRWLDHLLSLGARGPGNQRKHLEYIAGSG